MRIDEVLDTKAPKKGWSGDEDLMNLDFTPSNGIPYVLSIMSMVMAPDEIEYWNFFPEADDDLLDSGKFVEFEQKPDQPYGHGKQGIENTGAAAEIFGIVVDGILQYVKKYKPPFLIFQAAEPSRRRLYSSIVKRMLGSMPGWAVKEDDGIYALYNTKRIG